MNPPGNAKALTAGTSTTANVQGRLGLCAFAGRSAGRSSARTPAVPGRRRPPSPCVSPDRTACRSGSPAPRSSATAPSGPLPDWSRRRRQTASPRAWRPVHLSLHDLQLQLMRVAWNGNDNQQGTRTMGARIDSECNPRTRTHRFKRHSVRRPDRTSKAMTARRARRPFPRLAARLRRWHEAPARAHRRTAV
jgi:hypothetical protein